MDHTETEIQDALDTATNYVRLHIYAEDRAYVIIPRDWDEPDGCTTGGNFMTAKNALEDWCSDMINFAMHHLGHPGDYDSPQVEDLVRSAIEDAWEAWQEGHPDADFEEWGASEFDEETLLPGLTAIVQDLLADRAKTYAAYGWVADALDPVDMRDVDSMTNPIVWAVTQDGSTFHVVVDGDHDPRDVAWSYELANTYDAEGPHYDAEGNEHWTYRHLWEDDAENLDELTDEGMHYMLASVAGTTISRCITPPDDPQAQWVHVCSDGDIFTCPDNADITIK